MADGSKLWAGGSPGSRTGDKIAVYPSHSRASELRARHCLAQEKTVG